MTSEQGTDWTAWHTAYDEPASALSRRLGVVRELVRGALDRDPGGGIRAVSMCAGRGLDLIGALADHPHADRVNARLVELDPRNVAAIRANAAEAGLALDIVCGDAADTRLYTGAVPADIVLACGILGNISDADVFATLSALPQFCAAGATLVWTRHRRPPDLTARIRAAVADAGFLEAAFVAPDDVSWTVGAAVFAGESAPLRPARLFTFIR